MANEIKAYHRSGKALYATIRNAAGSVWNGSAFEAWGTGGHTAADYDIALTDKSGSLYLGTFPACAAGYYLLIFYDRATASPLDTDYAVDHEEGYWTGTIWYDEKTFLYEILLDTGTTIPATLATIVTNTGKVILGTLSSSGVKKPINTSTSPNFVEDD